MKKIITLALIGAFGFASPACAQSMNDEKIKADVQALDKDNKALSEKRAVLSQDRAAKAIDKANDNNGKQAVDSVKIGADKMGIAEKKTEKGVDEKILAHHKEEINKDNTKD